MKQYARIDGGVVREVIDAAYTDVDVYSPPVTGAAPEEERTLLLAAGEEWPIEQRFAPEFVATLVLVPEGVPVVENYTYDGASFAPPPPYVPPTPSAEEVKARRNQLLTTANLRKGALQDAVDIGEATPEEEALLTKYKQYTTKLTRIEQQAGFPADVQWPDSPE